MYYDNVRITPPDLLPAISSPILSMDTRIKLEMTVISFEIELYPIELLAMVKLFGRSCIEVAWVKKDARELITEMSIRSALDSADHSTAQKYFERVERATGGSTDIIAQYRIHCKVQISGSNILNICDGVLCNLYVQADEGSDVVIVNNDELMTKVILPRVYKTAFDMFKVIGYNVPGGTTYNPHRVIDNPTTRVAVPEENASVLLFCTGTNGFVDFTGADLLQQVGKFNSRNDDPNAGETALPYKSAAFNGKSMIIFARISIIDFIMMQVTMPSSFNIIDSDDIPAISMWNDEFLSGIDALHRSYLLPADDKISCVVKINLTKGSGIEGINVNWEWYEKNFMHTIHQAFSVLKF